ncbi:hypothetical protein KBZ94_34625 [Streptomyces sp. RM72]|uniref:hypothetical protein n=1 Tax=Streptomyces sp. RM72 TaxID=1115510 RepID=UPI001B3981EC|nr:hypothetical protein [Streptomyces sp. RM72]MBQ0890003.1 hypothetical protein [Streptomyces sp. RM72]
MPTAHCGWVVFRHDSPGEAVGGPLFSAPAVYGWPDCTTDSARAAAFVAEFVAALRTPRTAR